MENRYGLAVSGMVTHANGTAERRASEIMLKAKRKAAGRRITAGEDKAYDTANHSPRSGCREILSHRRKRFNEKKRLFKNRGFYTPRPTMSQPQLEDRKNG